MLRQQLSVSCSNRKMTLVTCCRYTPFIRQTAHLGMLVKSFAVRALQARPPYPVPLRREKKFHSQTNASNIYAQQSALQSFAMEQQKQLEPRTAVKHAKTFKKKIKVKANHATQITNNSRPVKQIGQTVD